MPQPFIPPPPGRPRPCNSRRFGAVLFFTSLFFGVLSLACGGAGYMPQQGGGAGEGPGHRQQRLALTPQQELELGRKAYHEVLSNPDKYGRALPANSPEV